MTWQVVQGECLEVMRGMDANGVDAVVTDPPYELGFMGKRWDTTGIAYNITVWQEALRVLKPGGYLLAFGGTRTSHRLACAIEDAGFEIRDTIAWMYGSGFPKSLDVSKALDKMAGAEREVIGQTQVAGMFKQEYQIKQGYRPNNGNNGYAGERKGANITAPATLVARQWAGWGTALKPAHEPITVARKSLACPNVASNVMEWGTGAVNVDGCRIETSDNLNGGMYSQGEHKWANPSHQWGHKRQSGQYQQPAGRWPANVVLDEAAAAMLDEMSGTLKSGAITRDRIKSGHIQAGHAGKQLWTTRCEASEGGASRFFYCAKASRRERNAGLEGMATGQPTRHGARPCDWEAADWQSYNANHHPTVKPLALMRWLVRLVTPPGGTVLDPFTGSGSTGCAAVLEGFNFVGIEMDSDYVTIAERRIRHWAGEDLPLLAGLTP